MANREATAMNKSGVPGVFITSIGSWKVSTLARWGVKNRTLARRETQTEAEAIALKYFPTLEAAAVVSPASFEDALNTAREHLKLEVIINRL